MKQFRFNPIIVDFGKIQGDVRIYHSIEFKLLHFSSYYENGICLFNLYMMTANNSMMTADNSFMKRPRSYRLFIRILFMSINIIMNQEMGLVMFAKFFNFRKKFILIKGKPDPNLDEEENETDAPDKPTQEKPRYTGILEGMEWINWVAANENGEIVGYDDKPIKSDHWWNHPESEITLLTNDVLITPEQAISLCGRVPEWSDEEPTPVVPQGIVEQAISELVKITVDNLNDEDIAQIKTWAKYVATDEDGALHAFEIMPRKPDQPQHCKVWATSFGSRYQPITVKQSVMLCGRLPKWEDDEPTPVKK